MDRYIGLLFEEYKKATGYDFDFKNMEDDFYLWLKESKKAYELLANMYCYSDDKVRPIYRLVEFGKGKYDTVIPYLKKVCNGEVMAITPFKDSFGKNPSIKVYNGTLDIFESDVFVNYRHTKKYNDKPNCSYIYNNQIDTIVTELPVFDMNPYIRLFDSNKTVMIGKCGLANNLDKNDNIRYLENIYKSFNSDERREIVFDYTEHDKYYAAYVKVYTKLNEYNKIK